MVEVKDLNERKTGQEPVREQEEAGWFHICSQGLEGVDLFPDEKAFITGVNKFAAAFKLFGEDIEVAILVLVSTHFHSLAWGRRTDVVRCAERFKKTISMYYSHRFGTSKVMSRVWVKVDIDEERERAERAAQQAAANQDTREGASQANHTPYRAERMPRPNDPCPCGSGKKFKNCHGRNL